MEGLTLISSVEIATSICTSPQIRELIFKPIFRRLSVNITATEEKEAFSRRFQEIEEETLKILENYPCPSEIGEKIFSLVLLISRKLLRWAFYHYRDFGIPLDFSRDVLKKSLFDQQGTIDYVTALNELLSDTRIDRLKRNDIYYNFYFGVSSDRSFNEVYKRLKEIFIINENGDLVNLPNLIKRLADTWDNTFDYIEYFLFVLEPSIMKANFILLKHYPTSYMRKNKVEIVLSLLSSIAEKYSGTYLNSTIRWVPEDYFMNSLLYLFNQLNEKEQTDMFHLCKNKCCYRVLEGLLDWPFQVHFLRYAQLMWGNLRFDDFAFILIKIINKNEDYEGEICDYKCLFKEFWLNSPDSYKNFICREKFENEFYIILIIQKLLELHPCTHFDQYNLKLMYEHARKINDSNMIFNLLMNITGKLRRKEMKESAETFLKCTLLPEHISNFKNKFIKSAEGEKSLKYFIIQNKLKEADDLVKWCLPLENSREEFKINFFLSKKYDELHVSFRSRGTYRIG